MLCTILFKTFSLLLIFSRCLLPVGNFKSPALLSTLSSKMTLLSNFSDKNNKYQEVTLSTIHWIHGKETFTDNSVFNGSHCEEEATGLILSALNRNKAAWQDTMQMQMVTEPN